MFKIDAGFKQFNIEDYVGVCKGFVPIDFGFSCGFLRYFSYR